MNRNSFKYCSLVNKKVVGVSAGAENKGVVLTTKRLKGCLSQTVSFRVLTPPPLRCSEAGHHVCEAHSEQGSEKELQVHQEAPRLHRLQAGPARGGGGLLLLWCCCLLAR